VGFDEYDEEKYLRANPDVAVMVERGIFKSPLEHWQKSGSLEHSAGRRRSGFYEHDLLYDEEIYLRSNPDVLALVKKRILGSGYEHWMRHGRVEFERGRRHAPYAESHPFRPFRLAFSGAGGLLVGAADIEPGPDAALTAQHGDEPRLSLPRSALTLTGPLRLVDALFRPRDLRLLLVRLPAFSADGRRPRPVVLSNGAATVLLSRDAGMQAFFFESGTDANDFLRHAQGLDVPPSPAYSAALVDFVIGRLMRPADPREPHSGFVLESLVCHPGRGFEAIGWFCPARDEVTRVSVISPETLECADAESLTRVERPDVLGALAGIRGSPGDPGLGFRAFFPLPLASERTPSRLVLGVTLKSGVARFFESREIARLLAP